MADIIAETDRLILRTIEEGDAAEQDRVLNTPTVMARLGGNLPPDFRFIH